MIADDVSDEFMRKKFDETITWDKLSDSEKQKYNEDYKINKDKFEKYLMYEFVKLYYSDDKIKNKCKGQSRATINSIKSVMVSLAKKYSKDKYAKGGGVGYKKDWEVVGITMQGKKFKKTITLGRMSDREDVKNAIKRMQSDDFRVMEVTSIKELQTYATGGALSDAVKMTKEQLKETKDLFEKYSSKEKRKDLLKFKKSALKEYGKDIGGLYVKDVKRKAKFLADHPEIIVGKVF